MTLATTINDASLSASAAAQALAAPLSAAFAKGAQAGEDALWEFWNGVVDVAARTPHADQARLVGVVAALRASAAAPAEVEVWGERVAWRELPLLGPVLREAWDDEECDRVSLNSFAARLTAAGVADFSLYGIWTLRGALEEAGLPKLAEVPAAATWLVYAGETIRALCKEGRTYEGRVAVPGAAVAERAWTGYNEERWKFWADQWKEVNEDEVPLQSRSLVAEAVKELERPSDL